MRFLSGFSGIEAASVAWKPIGFEPVAYMEIDPFACAVLTHHHPRVPNLGDVSTVDEAAISPLGPINGFVFGWPCQDLSVAGKRAGLTGKRSGLFYEATRILRLCERYAGCRWFVAENVPGLLSSHSGRDFGEVIRETTGLTIPVPSAGWGNGGVVARNDGGWSIAWRVLDAQFFGVPQRRRRVFVVGHLGDWRRAAAVLFERHSLSGNPAPCREAGAGVAASITGSLGRRGGVPDGGDTEGQLIGVARERTSHAGRFDGDTETFIAHTLRADGFDASEDGTGRGTPMVPVPIDLRQASRGEKLTNNRATGSGGPPGVGVGQPGDPAFTVSERGQCVALPFDTTQITSALNRSQPNPGDPCHPLASGAHPPAIAFNWQAAGTKAMLGVSEERTTALGTTQTPAVAIGLDLRNMNYTDGVTHTIQAKGSPGYSLANTPSIQLPGGVRRLTPRECERLQGFPDDYTLVPYRGKPAADGPRYKSLGNSMAVPVMRWIGRRILEAS